MARKKISELRAKQILHKALGLSYEGIAFDAQNDNEKKLSLLHKGKTYVVKVDEGIKKRMKQGLVSLNKSPKALVTEIKKFQEMGYRHFIIEPFVPHEDSSEKYLSIERVRNGLQILYSSQGGITIEDNQDAVNKVIIHAHNSHDVDTIAGDFSLSKEILQKLIRAFNENYFSFLEINPLVIEQKTVYFLDIAAEVDSAGEFFVQHAWSADDFRTGERKEKTEEELNIIKLAYNSQASFTFNLLNPNGAIFMLLSGGGASIVLADEVYNLGFGKQLANYGEYSGNPLAEEVYLYTKNLLKLLLQSKASKKVLLIGGGVANFTDVRKTFTGIIKAISESREVLQKQRVKIFVRRGGPHQEEGLAMMEKFLKDVGLYGFVGDQTKSLPEIVQMAVGGIKS